MAFETWVIVRLVVSSAKNDAENDCENPDACAFSLKHVRANCRSVQPSSRKREIQANIDSQLKTTSEGERMHAQPSFKPRPRLETS
mmetsp:Transcript_21427/g.51052  ORF Transcript_21427/g.51052 Transcript_21427/m.51052 type:complete len:86 (+) Transcript_21427:289-546(+)